MRATVLAAAHWITSSHSTNNGTCVEVAFDHDRVAARDSKHPDGGVLTFPAAAFREFLRVLGR